MNRREIFAVGALTAALAATPAGAQPRRRRIAIETRDGVPLFHRETGDGQPLLFMAGWALPSDVWNYQTVALAAHGFRCIAYDRRGHGRSHDPGRGYDFDTLSDDLAAVLEQLDLNSVTLIGHSFASGEMVRYMTRHRGRRVSKLIFIAPAATPFPAQFIPPIIAEQLRERKLMHDFPRALREGLPPFLTPASSQGMLDWVFNMMLGASHSAIVGCNIALTTADFRAELPRVTVPSLILHGTRDVSAPIDFTGRPTAVAIPGAELKVYENAPHGVFLTEIDRVNADIAAFV
jgi:pimeloyl-ACP methyl ester carboxylesterase